MEPHDLAEMTDPEFFKLWAKARMKLAATPENDPRHEEARAAYKVLLTEYYRRMDGM